ncbi:hypothetical protein [Mycobacterium sp. HNNTM2301]|uniref:hypothetical protein n=1 Tax=Mycobacterium hainanense TaxID=3289775 RepID=UPI0035A63EFC
MATPDMGSPAVALLVGFAAAAATVVVALINRRVSKGDERDRLKRDIELVKELRDGAREKRLLEQSVAERIERVVIHEEPAVRNFRRQAFISFVFLEGLLLAQMVLGLLGHRGEQFQSALNGIITSGVIAAAIALLYTGLRYERERNQVSNYFLKKFPEGDDPPPAQR